MPEQYFNVVNYYTYQMENQVTKDKKKDNNQQRMTRRKNYSMKYPTKVQRIDEFIVKCYTSHWNLTEINFIVWTSTSSSPSSVGALDVSPIKDAYAPWKTWDSFLVCNTCLDSVLGMLVSYTNTWIHYPAFGFYAFKASHFWWGEACVNLLTFHLPLIFSILSVLLMLIILSFASIQWSHY